MDPLRIGVVGCGVITRLHLSGYKVLNDSGLGEVEVVALCSRDRAHAEHYTGHRCRKGDDLDPRADPLQRTYDSGPIGVRDINLRGRDATWHADWRELVARDDVDVVEVLTPPALHAEIARAAIEAGKHVFVEKPLGITMRDSRELVEAAAAADRRLAAGLNLRFDPRWRAARWIVETGRVGRVRTFVSQSFRGPGHWSAGFGSVLGRVVGNLRDKLAWRFPHLVPRPRGPAWRYRLAEVGAGELGENGVHLFDFARYLAGEIDSVSGVMTRFEEGGHPDADSEDLPDICDAFASVIRFREGGFGQIALSRAARGDALNPRENFLVHGATGSVSHERYHFADGKQGAPWELFQAEADAETRERLLPAGITHRFGLQKIDFVRAIRDGRAPEVDGADALRTQAACYAVAESSVLGREVSVDDVLSGDVHAFQDRIERAARSLAT